MHGSDAFRCARTVGWPSYRSGGGCRFYRHNPHWNATALPLQQTGLLLGCIPLIIQGTGSLDQFSCCHQRLKPLFDLNLTHLQCLGDGLHRQGFMCKQPQEQILCLAPQFIGPHGGVRFMGNGRIDVGHVYIRQWGLAWGCPVWSIPARGHGDGGTPGFTDAGCGPISHRTCAFCQFPRFNQLLQP